MKIGKFLLSGVSFVLISQYSLARPKYGMAGCGLGSIVMGPRGGQISAATTNETFSNQVFAISLGLSNCLPAKKIASLKKQKDYVINNFSILSKEIAQGRGESVTTLATIFGCQQQHIPLFKETLKKSYKSIFSAPGILASLEEMHITVKNNKLLSQQCKNII
jgi:hypothetical protein